MPLATSATAAVLFAGLALVSSWRHNDVHIRVETPTMTLRYALDWQRANAVHLPKVEAFE